MQTENGMLIGADRSFTLFISYGSSYFLKFPEIFARIAELLIEGLKPLPSLGTRQFTLKCVALQLLFLNNFHESLALKVREVLEVVFARDYFDEIAYGARGIEAKR